jgi:hypothetical protein
MSEPHETDEISRDLEAIFADFYAPPTEMDLRGVDAATLALGLRYGFDSWQDVRVVANSRRRVATAARRWAEQHPSPEFLANAVGRDERSLEHLRLLERAHPGCPECEERLAELRAASADSIESELAWLVFQPIQSERGGGDEPGAAGLLHIPDRDEDMPIRAEDMGGGDWRITVRDPGARRATIRIRWTTGHETVHADTFENDLADIEAEAPAEGAVPESVQVQVTDAADDS